MRLESDPVIVVNGEGMSPFLLVCEHAGRLIPKALDDLGLTAADREAHIAWDIGAEGVARGLSERLAAPLVLQRYSRLIYDCNRPPEAPDAIPEVSELTPIPGNRGLTAAQRRERAEALYRPFHATVARLLDARAARGEPTILVTVHSFTPVYKGAERKLDLGILHDRDARLADTLMRALRQEPGLDARRNEPYGPQDGVTHTLKLHGLKRGIPNVMLEIRNDLIRDSGSQQSWAARLANALSKAASNLEELRAEVIGL